MLRLLLASLLAALALTACPRPHGPRLAAPGDAVRRIRRDAEAVLPLVASPWVKAFLAGAAELRPISPRTVYCDNPRTRCATAEDYDRMAIDQRAALVARVYDEEYFYETSYGSPVSYARPYELLAAAGLDGIAGKHVFDFGYGQIGSLTLAAIAGADAVGIDVEPLLPVLYSEPGDVGPVGQGRVTVLYGSFPADAAVRRAVGAGYHVFLAKNVLKLGYIHPAEPVDPSETIDLGVSDEEFVRAVAATLDPGGLFLIYNINPAPAPAGAKYVPWADGRCPFSRDVLEAAGFEVVALNADDSAAIRALGRALGWDKGEGAVDVERDLFAVYTLLRKR